MSIDTDDLLSRSTRALRETTDPAGAAGDEATLERIEQSLRARTRKHRRTYARFVVMPLAAAFVVLAAWASASGRLGRWIGTHQDPVVATTEPRSPPPPQPVTLPAPPPLATAPVAEET